MNAVSLSPFEPLVSVIIPVFDGERFIIGAVQSVLRQTYRHIEVWVVDDGSRDGTLDRLATVQDPRLRIIRQANAGAGAARNSALAEAKGAYIAFLDCDDRWFPDKIAVDLAVMRERSSESLIVYGGYYSVDRRGRLLHAPSLRNHVGNVFDVLIDGDNFLIPSSCMYDRRIFDSIGLFNSRSYHEDYDFTLRAVRCFPAYPTQRRLTVYQQTLTGKCRAILYDYDAAVEAEYFVIQELEPELSSTEVRRLADSLMRSLYLRFLMYGFDDHARRLLREARITGLGGGMKEMLGAVFARTGINGLIRARQAVYGVHRLVAARNWRRYLASTGLELRYD